MIKVFDNECRGESYSSEPNCKYYSLFWVDLRMVRIKIKKKSPNGEIAMSTPELIVIFDFQLREKRNECKKVDDVFCRL